MAVVAQKTQSGRGTSSPKNRELELRVDNAFRTGPTNTILSTIKNETHAWAYVISRLDYAQRICDPTTGDTFAHNLIRHSTVGELLVNSMASGNEQERKIALQIWGTPDKYGWTVGHCALTPNPLLAIKVLKLERPLAIEMLSFVRESKTSDESILDAVLRVHGRALGEAMAVALEIKKEFSDNPWLLKRSTGAVSAEPDTSSFKSSLPQEVKPLVLPELTENTNDETATTQLPKIPEPIKTDPPAEIKKEPALTLEDEEDEIEDMVASGNVKELKDRINAIGPDGKIDPEKDFYAKYLFHNRISLNIDLDDNKWTLLHELVLRNSDIAVEILGLEPKEALKLLSKKTEDEVLVGEVAAFAHRSVAYLVYEKPWLLTLICSDGSFLAEFAFFKHRSAAQYVIKNRETILKGMKDEPGRADKLLRLADALLHMSAVKRDK